MGYLLRLNVYARLAIIFGISLLIHLAIIYGVPWRGADGFTHPSKIPGTQRRLTVTIASSPLHTTPEAQKNLTTEQPDVSKMVNADTDIGKSSSTDFGFPQASGSHYFSLSELDQNPAIVQDIPANPQELLGYLQGGELVLRLWIDAAGKVEKLEVVSSNLPSAFVDSARSSFMQAIFAPGLKQGNAVPSVMEVVVNYAPAKQ